MKIELNHSEIGDAIALWLQTKLMDATTLKVDVKRADGIGTTGGATRYTITAEATPVEGYGLKTTDDKAAA